MRPQLQGSETVVAVWLGTPISASTVAQVMGINLVSSIILQIEPMLLAGLAGKGILSLSQVGRVATIELATLAIVMTWSVARLPYTHVRKYCMLAALVALTANFMSAWLTSVPAIYGVRALSGGASGIFLWTIIGIITRSGSPARLNGINISVQCAASLVAATIFSSFVIPHFGAGAGFTILGALGALVFLTTFSLPRTFDPPSLSVEGGGALGKSGWIALLSVFLSMAAVLSIWVYIPSLAVLWGYPDWAARSAVPFGIGMEACGGLAVVLLSRWIGWRRGLTLSLLTLLLIGLALSVEQSPVIYIAVTGGAGFAWMVTMSLQLPFAEFVDPSRRSMAFVSPAQFLGAGVGPAIASAGVHADDVRGALYIAALMLAASLGCMAIAVLRRSPLITPNRKTKSPSLPSE